MAATDARRRIRNAINRVYGVIKLTTTLNPIGSPLTTPDAERSIDGAAFADCTDEAHENGAAGYFYVELTAAECAADHVTFQQKCADANAITYIEDIYFEAAADSGILAGASGAGGALRASAVATDDYYNGLDIEIVRGTGAGQVRRITDYTGSSQVFTIDRSWATNPDTSSTYLIRPATGPALNTLLDANADVRCAGGITALRSDIGEAMAYGPLANNVGFVNAGTPTTTDFITSFSSAVTDAYKNCVLTFSTGALRGESAEITAYDASTKIVTVTPAFSAAPADQDQFIVSGLFI